MSSLGPFSLKTVGRFAFWLAAWPFLAILGVAVTMRAVTATVSRLVRATKARRNQLACPRGHANEVIGRWACDRCGAEYLGWVGACENCGDQSPDWLPCERCGLAIALPWRRDS